MKEGHPSPTPTPGSGRLDCGYRTPPLGSVQRVISPRDIILQKGTYAHTIYEPRGVVNLSAGAYHQAAEFCAVVSVKAGESHVPHRLNPRVHVDRMIWKIQDPKPSTWFTVGLHISATHYSRIRDAIDEWRAACRVVYAFDNPNSRDLLRIPPPWDRRIVTNGSRRCVNSLVDRLAVFAVCE